MIRALTTDDGPALTDFLDDFARAGEPIIPAWFCPRDWPIERVVRTLQGWQRGQGLQGSQVPTTTSFFVEDGAVLGVSNVRHRLNGRLQWWGGHVGYSVRPSARGRGIATALLSHAIEQCRGHGVRAMIVTCDPDNPASAKVIEKCGGKRMTTYTWAEMQRGVLWHRILTSDGVDSPA